MRTRIIFVSLILIYALSLGSTVQAAMFRLAWVDNATNETGTKIERKLGTTGTYAQINTVGVNAVSYTDSTLAAGTQYCYRVRAFNLSGDSGYSNEACGTTDAVPATPSGLTATP